MLAGTFGRDPWKADEPYSVNLTYNIVRTGDWVVPRLAGEPFLEKPPLFYLVAAGFAKVLSPWMPMHDASRFACILFMLTTLAFLALAAGELYGKEHRATAALLLLGCLHLQVTAHKLITDQALLAGLSMALYGFALSSRRPLAGGLWLGAGAGVGFLSKGLLAPGILAVIAVCLPVLSSFWRSRRYVHTLAAAFGAALPWLLVWPIALFRRSPDLFWEWFWRQNMGRFFGFANAISNDTHTFYLRNLPWLTWPVLPLALWAVWRSRTSLRRRPELLFPVAAFLTMFCVLSASASVRALYALPLLLPLSLLAVPGATMLTERAQTLIGRASLLFFGLFVTADWALYATSLAGRRGWTASLLEDLFAGAVPRLVLPLLAAAILLTAAWLLFTAIALRSRVPAALSWAAGVVFAWSIAVAHWMPAIDAVTSDRAAFRSLQQALPADSKSIASLGLGDSERGMLDYVAQIRTTRLEVCSHCVYDLLLVQSPVKPWKPGPGQGWKILWQYRKSDEDEQGYFTLYQRTRHAGLAEVRLDRNDARSPSSRTQQPGQRKPFDKTADGV